MRKLLLATFLASTVAAGPALAHQLIIRDCRPYAIAMHCDADMPSCGRPHMLYAPGESIAGNPAGTYFYTTPAAAEGHSRHWRHGRHQGSFGHRHCGCHHMHILQPEG